MNKGYVNQKAKSKIITSNDFKNTPDSQNWCKTSLKNGTIYIIQKINKKSRYGRSQHKNRFRNLIDAKDLLVIIRFIIGAHLLPMVSGETTRKIHDRNSNTIRDC